MDDIALIVEKEYRDYCDKVCRCSECKYEHCDMSCKIDYISDKLCLIRKDDEDED